MLLSSNMVTSNMVTSNMMTSDTVASSPSATSLLESLHKLGSNQDAKMIFRTEMNSSLEIIRFKSPTTTSSSSHQTTSFSRQTPPPSSVDSKPSSSAINTTSLSQPGGTGPSVLPPELAARLQMPPAFQPTPADSDAVAMGISAEVHHQPRFLMEDAGDSSVGELRPEFKSECLPSAAGGGGMITSAVVSNNNNSMSSAVVDNELLDRSHLPPVAERFQCNQCAYKTNKKSNFDKHVKTVHLKQKSTCEICHNSFSNLPQHIRLQHRTTQSKLAKLHKQISQQQQDIINNKQALSDEAVLRGDDGEGCVDAEDGDVSPRT